MSLFLVNSGPANAAPAKDLKLICAELKAGGYKHYLAGFGPEEEESGRGTELRVLPVKVGGFLGAWKLTRMFRSHRAAVVDAVGTASAGRIMAAALRAGTAVKVISLRTGDAPAALKPLAGLVDAVIVPSEGLKAVAVRAGFREESIAVIPPGLDFSMFAGGGLAASSEEPAIRSIWKALRLSADDFLVGVIGHLGDHNTYQALLEAAAVLARKAPEAKLVVFGEGDLNLDGGAPPSARTADNIRYYLGFGDKVEPAVGSLDAFVMFSHLEGLGRRVVTAMASGVPVVAADINGLPSVLVHRETGLMVPARNAEALAEAVLKLYFDRGLGARLGRAGRNAVMAEYSEEASARKTVELYKRLAAAKGIML